MFGFCNFFVTFHCHQRSGSGSMPMGDRGLSACQRIQQAEYMLTGELLLQRSQDQARVYRWVAWPTRLGFKYLSTFGCQQESALYADSSESPGIAQVMTWKYLYARLKVYTFLALQEKSYVRLWRSFMRAHAMYLDEVAKQQQEGALVISFFHRHLDYRKR